MKHYLLLLITLISAVSFGQGSGDVVFYSNSGEKFYVVMNGVRQNMAPETNVKVQGLTNQWYGCKIISSTNSFELEKNIPVKFDTLITYQIVGKKGKYKLRYFSETPMKSAPTTGGQTIVTYSPTENTGGTTTNVGTTGTTTTVGTTGTTTNVGTTGTTTTVGTTGTTGTTTTTNVGTTGVGTTTSVGTTGTTTTTTTTGTTTGTGDTESINISINVSENGMGMNVTGTGTGTGTTNTNTTTTNNGTTTVQTTTTTTSGGNGTTTYYEETTTTTTNTGNIYQDPDMTVTMTTTGTGVGTTTTGVGTTTTTTGTTGTNTNVGTTGTTTTTTNNGNCYTSDADFAAMKKSVNAETFEDDQLRVAKLAAKNKCMSVKQIGEIMKIFKFSEAQLDFAKYAYGNCSNKADYYQLMEIFTFSDDKEALEKFINAQ